MMLGYLQFIKVNVLEEWIIRELVHHVEMAQMRNAKKILKSASSEFPYIDAGLPPAHKRCIMYQRRSEWFIEKCITRLLAHTFSVVLCSFSTIFKEHTQQWGIKSTMQDSYTSTVNSLWKDIHSYMYLQWNTIIYFMHAKAVGNNNHLQYTV